MGTGAEELGFETFGTACGLAVIAGALSLVVPAFVTLTAALAALAVAGWASAHRRGPSGLAYPARGVLTYGGAFAAIGAGVVVFVGGNGVFAASRGLLLGVALVPLWVAERTRRQGARRAIGVV